MQQPLDHPYQLQPEQHDKKAYNSLLQLEQPPQPFVWTGRPYSLWVDVKREVNSEPRFLLFPFVFYPLGIFYCYAEYSLWTGVAFGVVVALLALLAVLLPQYYRQHTFYGITAEEVWVKKPFKTLEKYPIASLTRLTAQATSLSYSFIKNNEYEKYFLFKNIHQPENLHTLISNFQQKP